MNLRHSNVKWLYLCVCLCAYLAPIHVFRRQRVVQGDVIGYFLHEPLEALASMFLPGRKVQTTHSEARTLE